MRIGVISDTHDHVVNIRKAMHIFKQERVERILHCGDHIAPFCVPLYATAGIPIIAIYGNNDGERHGLLLQFQELENATLHQFRPHGLELGGRKILMMHEGNFLEDFIHCGEYDLILYGHDHQKCIRQEKNCLIINPGEACGYLTQTATVAIVDLSQMVAEFKVIY
ncbi:MAG: metallophosphoesterase, partial [Gemmatimonadetes bacterium]